MRMKSVLSEGGGGGGSTVVTMAATAASAVAASGRCRQSWNVYYVFNLKKNLEKQDFFSAEEENSKKIYNITQ